jgi:hypothetical protein
MSGTLCVERYGPGFEDGLTDLETHLRENHHHDMDTPEKQLVHKITRTGAYQAAQATWQVLGH